MTITIREDDPPTASVSLLARFAAVDPNSPEQPETEQRVSVRIAAELASDSEGWQIMSATYERVEGRFPF